MDSFTLMLMALLFLLVPLLLCSLIIWDLIPKITPPPNKDFSDPRMLLTGTKENPAPRIHNSDH